MATDERLLHEIQNQGLRFDRIDARLGDMERRMDSYEQRGDTVAGMFEKILDASTEAKTHVAEMKGKLETFTDSMQQICVLKHEQVDERFDHLAQERINDRNSSRVRDTVRMSMTHDWHKAIWTLVGGIILAIVTGITTYRVGVATNRAIASPVPMTQSSAH